MAETPQKNNQPPTTLPPRRGRVKAQIFESLAGNLSAAAKSLAKIKWIPSTPPASASTSAATSTPTSPRPSSYASDGYTYQA